jgi:hypothetical protein
MSTNPYRQRNVKMNNLNDDKANANNPSFTNPGKDTASLEKHPDLGSKGMSKNDQPGQDQVKGQAQGKNIQKNK